MSLSFPTAPTVGQAYQGWIWNGAAWDPNYAGMLVTSVNAQKGDVKGLPQLILTNNVVNAAACPFILPVATYKRFQIRFDGLVALTAGSVVGLQVSNNNGASWDNAQDYNWNLLYMQGGGSAAGAGSGLGANLAQIFGALDMSAVGTGQPGVGVIDFALTGAQGHSAGNAACYVQNNTGITYGMWTAFSNPVLANQNAIRLVVGQGNITVNASLFGFPN